MKRSTVESFTILMLAAVSGTAMAGCSGELTAHVTPKTPSQVSLPPACRAMGPLRLDMSYAKAVAAMGVPSFESNSSNPANSSVIYLFPRGLLKTLRNHPRPENYVLERLAYITLRFSNDKLISIRSSANSPYAALPYGVGDIRVHEPTADLLKRVKTPPQWVMTRDAILFHPYPFEVEVNTKTNNVNGITIAVKTSDNLIQFGALPAFEFGKDASTGLVNAVRIIAPAY